MTTTLENPRWLALSRERQSKLLDEHRNVNVEYDWWDNLFEDFTQQLAETGIAVDTREVKLMNGKTRQDPSIYFSGFWSQGDGAYFEGRVSDWPEFLAVLGKKNWAVPGKENWADWADWANEYNWEASSVASPRSNNMIVRTKLNTPENPHDEEDDPLRFHAWNILRPPPTEAELMALESAIESEFEDLADKLYENLEAEHDYLTNDEQVVDWILNNLDDEELRGEETKELSTE